MSSALLLVAALAVVQQPGGGSELERLRGLERRADSLNALRTADRERQSRADSAERVGVRATHGTISAVWLPGLGGDVTRRVSERADSLLDAQGIVPRDFRRSVLLVQDGVSGASGYRAQASDSGQVLGLDWHTRAGEVNGGRQIARAISIRYRSTLHTSWTSQWLSDDLGYLWRRESEADRAARALLSPTLDVARRCLAGDTGGCISYLGLDDTAQPLRDRYSVADLRAMIATTYQGSVRREACRNGDNAACYALVQDGDLSVGAVPAPPEVRDGLLRYIASAHGLEALSELLADTVGTLGERFARAGGTSLDSLVASWRVWTLRGGAADRVRSDYRAAVPLLIASLLAFGIAAGRRWAWFA